jgi:hypothetical protein
MEIILALNRLLVNSYLQQLRSLALKLQVQTLFGYYVPVGCFLIFHYHLIISEQQCSPQTADWNCTFIIFLLCLSAYERIRANIISKF